MLHYKILFEKLYLIKLGPNFVGSALSQGTSNHNILKVRYFLCKIFKILHPQGGNATTQLRLECNSHTWILSIMHPFLIHHNLAWNGNFDKMLSKIICLISSVLSKLVFSLFKNRWCREREKYFWSRLHEKICENCSDLTDHGDRA